MSELRGVDVSSWQGPPGQWHDYAGAIAFAGVKITELSAAGPYVNPDAAADWEWLRQGGRSRIGYLYGHPGVSAEASAALFLTEITRLGVTGSDMIALDIEETDGQDPAAVAAWCGQVLAILERDLGRLPLVYTYPDFAANCAGLGRYPLWISAPSDPPGRPAVPRPWKTWSIHQFDTAAPIDQNIAAYTHPRQMTAILGKPSIPQEKPPKPPKEHKAREHRVRRTARKARHVARKEPVLTAAAANSAIAAAVVWEAGHLGLHLTHTQKSAVLTIVVALAGLAAALLTRPARVTAAFTALGTAATAAAAFGLHLPAAVIGGEAPLISLILAGILRGHVSPAPVAAEPGPDETAVPAVTAVPGVPPVPVPPLVPPAAPLIPG
jgi:lysozyme